MPYINKTRTYSIRSIAMMTGVSLLAVSLIGCSSGKTADNNTLEVLTNMATGSPQLTTLANVTKQFEQENKGVKVRLVPSGSNYEQDIKVRLAAKNAPDVWDTHGWSRDRYANFLEDLHSRAWAKQLVPTARDVLSKKDGSFYALPLDVQVSGIFYNKDVLAKAGVDDGGIKNWDDFKTACQRLADNGASCIGASGKENWMSGNIADFSATGMYTKTELTELKRGKFQTKPYTDLTEMLEDWSKSGFFNVDYSSATTEDIARSMAQDKIGFVFQANSFQLNVMKYKENANLGFIPIPAKDGNRYVVTGEGHAYGVTKTGKHKDIALKYIDFLAQPKIVEQLTKTLGNAASMKGAKSGLGKLDTSYQRWVNKEKVTQQPIFDREYLPSGMWDTMVSSTDSVISGQHDSVAATDQMKVAFESLYGQSKK